MTIQMSDLAAQRTPDGWRIASVPWGGNSWVHLLDEEGETLESVGLGSSFEGFSNFAHDTTAGWDWSQQMLAYFAEVSGRSCFVVRAWWGPRLVLDLDELCALESHEMADELRDIEAERVLTGLGQLVAETEDGTEAEYDRSSDVLRCTVDTLVHWPGMLGLSEAVPMLRVLEERLEHGSRVLSRFSYRQRTTRLLVQISLRRLGETPRCHPVISFEECSRREERAPLYEPQPGPIDGRTRLARLPQIRHSMPAVEVYRLLGGPDYLTGVDGEACWRYDIDADEPYSVLIGLSDDDTVERIVRFTPALWKGPELFTETDLPVYFHDGAVAVSFGGFFRGSRFLGHRVDLGVLQEIEATGVYPQAQLARLLFEGDLSANYPLADALEEVGDPKASRVRSWLPGDSESAE